MYKEVNDPSTSNEQKKFTAGPPPVGNDVPLLDFKLFQPKPMGKPAPQPAYPYMYGYPHTTMGMAPIPAKLPGIPIINEYKINVGPTDVSAALIFEGELPVIESSGITINDRLGMYNYLKSILFSRGSGEDIDITKYGESSLLSHLKIIEINPYNYNKISKNPYRGLPDGFLIYRSCYPIRYNRSSVSTQCAKNSTGANIRMYKMLEGSYLATKYNPQTRYADYDELREIGYYEFIRETILKLYKSPNFTLMYGYYITEKANIDYDSINRIKYGTCMTAQKPKPAQFQRGPTTFPFIHPMLRKYQPIDPNSYTGKSLIMLTEAPTYNIIKWASILYEDNGNVKRAISTGYHSDRVWYSILFQIMAALYTLQISDICINNMSLEKNVYIKDLSSHGNVTNFWKYRINGVEYYIPNYGYLVLIDSHFKNIDSMPSVPYHTLQGKIFMDQVVDTRGIMLDQLKNIINPNNFSQEFINSGGCSVSDKIKELLNSIYLDLNIPNANIYLIDFYILKHMTMFLHNRIGGYLKEGEIIYIRRMEMKEFRKGEIVVYEIFSGTYKFALFIELRVGGNCTILSSEQGKIILQEVNINSLLKYADIPIEQDFKANEMNFSEIYEVYTV
jgi:hypothetical protein